MFSRVLKPSLGIGVRAGLLAAAATSGTVVGLGLRDGSALMPFVLLGRSLFARVTGVLPQPAVALIAGIVVHTGWMVVWGVCFTVVAARLRWPRVLIAALLVSVIAGLLARRLWPFALGAAAMASLSAPETFLYLVLLGLSLATGTRLASPDGSHHAWVS